VAAAIPEDVKPIQNDEGLEDAFALWVSPSWSAWQGPLKRYLAAKAFANWTAHQGRGLRAVIRGLEAAVSLVRIEASRQCLDAARSLDAGLLREAIRGADFALNHLAVGDQLAKRWSRAEEG
jgi:hypothetical protein